MTHYWQNDLVRLRSLEPEDWQFFYDWNLETEDQMKMDTLWFPTSTQHVKRWIEKQLAETISREEWYFVIETLAGETVGMINTRDCKVHDRRFSYGVGVRQAFRGKGYAKAAIQLVLAYYFRHKGYQRVEVEVYGFNPPSARLHERLGFQLEGTRRAAKWHDGAFHDIWIYGLLASEWEG